MAQWYYGENGQQTGPVEEETLRQAIAGGQVGPQTLVWREGMLNWLPLQQVPELAGAANPYSPSPYGAVPGYGVAPPNSGLAVASMVCGIVGIVGMLACFGGLASIPAVICGHLALKQINEASLPMSGRGMALAGLILGYLGICLTILGVLFVVFNASSHP